MRIYVAADPVSAELLKERLEVEAGREGGWEIVEESQLAIYDSTQLRNPPQRPYLGRHLVVSTGK